LCRQTFKEKKTPDPCGGRALKIICRQTFKQGGISNNVVRCATTMRLASVRVNPIRRHDEGEVMHAYPSPTPDTPFLYHMSARSRASRIVELRGNNRSSFVGAFVAWLKGRWQTLVFESRHELLTAYLLLGTPGLQDLHEQPPRIQYVGLNGLPTFHTFDFLATINDRRYAVACKFKNSAERLHFREQLALIKGQFAGFADEVLLVTEQDYSREQAVQAELFHHINSRSDEESDAVVFALVNSLVGTVAIETVIKASGLEKSRAWRSIVRLAGRRRLWVEPGHRIDNYGTPIRRWVR
jgi:hypothetical protein